jgi:hypothetical protein
VIVARTDTLGGAGAAEGVLTNRSPKEEHMPWFRVVVSRTEHMRADLDVKADSVEEAEERAMECDSDQFETVDAEQSVRSCRPLDVDARTDLPAEHTPF